MKPIVITQDAEMLLVKEFLAKFKKELDTFKFNVNDTKISVAFDVSQPAKEKVKIMFTQDAYIKMKSLVDFYDTEVSWYGLVEKLENKLFRVYDVKICKQYVNGGKVDTEDEDTLEFFNSLTDDEAEHMHYQAHSHVKMSTSASCIDLQNQADVVHNIGKEGFYIFQIWNKSNEISTYLYDLDENMFYDSKDVEIDIEGAGETINEFLMSTVDLVIEKKYTYTPTNKKNESMYPKQWENLGKTNEPKSYNGYGCYGGYEGYYEERWD